MPSRYPSRRRIKRSRYAPAPIGEPKFGKGQQIGDFTVIYYLGHSDVNKRNNHIMAKPQHWYRCVCTCGNEENRSQQELNDERRNQCCYACRDEINSEDP
jgi:hypothetical protein